MIDAHISSALRLAGSLAILALSACQTSVPSGPPRPDPELVTDESLAEQLTIRCVIERPDGLTPRPVTFQPPGGEQLIAFSTSPNGPTDAIDWYNRSSPAQRETIYISGIRPDCTIRVTADRIGFQSYSFVADTFRQADLPFATDGAVGFALQRARDDAEFDQRLRRDGYFLIVFGTKADGTTIVMHHLVSNGRFLATETRRPKPVPPNVIVMTQQDDGQP